MNYIQYIFGLLCLCIVCIQKSSAISCYECNSAQDKRCIGDLNNQLSDELRKACPEKKGDKPYTLCRKIKQVIDFEVNGLQPDSRVIRTCGYEDSQYENRCYQRSGFGGRQEVCACQEDNCNGSSFIAASASLVVALLVISRINIF